MDDRATHRSTHATRATHVTFFEDRAQVERAATATLGAGLHELVLTGLTTLVDDTSLAVTLRDAASKSAPQQGVKLLSASVRRRLLETREVDEARVDELRERAKEASRRHRELQQELLRITAQTQRLRELEQGVLRQLRQAPDGEACEGEEVWRASLEALDERFKAQRGAEGDCLDALEDAEQAQRRAEELLSQALTTSHDLVAQAELQILVEEPCTLDLCLRYVTPCALWRPSHRARLKRSGEEGSKAELELERQATVWQLTSEAWEGVQCSFSTARPAQSAMPPLLSDDVLRTRPKTDHERQTVHVTARDQAIEKTGQSGTREVAQMPGVDDGGEPQTFHAAERVSIKSSSLPSTLPIDVITLPAKVDLVAMPELSPVAHLRARTTWRHATPLLAGPVTLVREQELAGVAPIPFTAPGEALEIGFGAESSLRIQREVEREEIPRKLSRKRHEKRTITLYVSNLSAQRHTLSLIERVPVSELEQVTVSLLESEGARPDQDGLLDIKVGLGPNQHTKHTVAYELELDPKVYLDF